MRVVRFITRTKFPICLLNERRISSEFLVIFWGHIRMNFFANSLLKSMTFICFKMKISILVSLIISRASSISDVVVLTGSKRVEFTLVDT